MAFPDRIERTVEIAHPPSKVWAALTTAEELGTWSATSLGSPTVPPRGLGQMSWTGGHKAELRIERVEEPSVFAYAWRYYGLPDTDPRRTYVEFTLEPVGDGTRLTVVESGFAQLSDDVHGTAFDGNTTESWGTNWANWSPTSTPLDPHMRNANPAEARSPAQACPPAQARPPADPDRPAARASSRTSRRSPSRSSSPLADPSRRGILASLASGEPPATDLANRLPITRQAIAKHLSLLADAGLVTTRTRRAAPGPLPTPFGSHAGGATVSAWLATGTARSPP